MERTTAKQLLRTIHRERIQWLVLIAIQMCLTIVLLFAIVTKQREANNRHIVSIKRITVASVRDFKGITKLGVYTGLNQVAVSHDLKKYLGWYCVFESISPELYLVSDTTHSRFKSTIDIYTLSPGSVAMKFGTTSDRVRFIPRKRLFNTL